MAFSHPLDSAQLSQLVQPLSTFCRPRPRMQPLSSALLSLARLQALDSALWREHSAPHCPLPELFEEAMQQVGPRAASELQHESHCTCLRLRRASN